MTNYVLLYVTCKVRYDMLLTKFYIYVFQGSSDKKLKVKYGPLTYENIFLMMTFLMHVILGLSQFRMQHDDNLDLNNIQHKVLQIILIV